MDRVDIAPHSRRPQPVATIDLMATTTFPTAQLREMALDIIANRVTSPARLKLLAAHLLDLIDAEDEYGTRIREIVKAIELPTKDG